MSVVASDMKRHLSSQLQDAIRRHAGIAEAALGPADVLFMMLGAVVDASCCAVSSVAATLANASSMSDPEVEALVNELIDRQNDALTSAKAAIIAKIVEALTIERAKAA